MSMLQLDGREIALDKDGYLVALADWSPAAAEALAGREELQLTAEHWEILELLRDFYAEFQLSPATPPLINASACCRGSPKVQFTSSASSAASRPLVPQPR